MRVRVCMAVVEAGRILLVPHYQTDAGTVQWVVPGGRLEAGERVQDAAAREFWEEIGLNAEAIRRLHVSEVILPERGYYSLTIAYLGRITGGTVRAEPGHPYGEKNPRWFSAVELRGASCHPVETVEKALGFKGGS